VNRIDVDDYVLLYIQYDDHLHRYAVPKHYTLAVMANRIIDSFDKEKPVKFRRSQMTKYNVFDEAGCNLPLSTCVDVLYDGASVVVKVEG